MRTIKFRAWDGEKIRFDFGVARPQAYDILSILLNCLGCFCFLPE